MLTTFCTNQNATFKKNHAFQLLHDLEQLDPKYFDLMFIVAIL